MKRGEETWLFSLRGVAATIDKKAAHDCQTQGKFELLMRCGLRLTAARPLKKLECQYTPCMAMQLYVIR